MAPLDIPAFVAAWTSIYNHFEAIGYIPDDTVTHPHASSPPIRLPLPLPEGDDMAENEIPLHPLVLELLPQLPYPVSYESSCSFEILPRTRAVPYTVEGELRNARDPLMYYLDEEPRVVGEGYLKPEEIVLTTQLPQGMTLILNVADGVLREYDASGLPPGPEEDYHFPNDIDHPHNWPALPAIETIWSYVRKFESLEWIAFEGRTELGILEPFDREHQRLRQILMEEYGWPEAFRKDDWIRERGELRRRLLNELYPDF